MAEMMNMGTDLDGMVLLNMMGKKRGVGRPRRADGQRTRSVCVTLYPEHHAWCDRQENLSEAIRLLIENEIERENGEARNP